MDHHPRLQFADRGGGEGVGVNEGKKTSKFIVELCRHDGFHTRRTQNLLFFTIIPFSCAWSTPLLRYIEETKDYAGTKKNRCQELIFKLASQFLL